MVRIFISYSRKNEDIARRLATDLDALGADIWIDVDDIPAGMNWSSAIQQGLDSCEVMILIISPESMASVNVENEWQYFLDHKHPVIPVLWQPTRVHFQLHRLQYIDFHTQPYASGLAQLHAVLRRIGLRLAPLSATGASVQPSLPQKPLPVRGEKFPRAYIAIGAVIALIMIAAIIILASNSVLGGSENKPSVTPTTQIAQNETDAPVTEPTPTETPTTAPTATPTLTSTRSESLAVTVTATYTPTLSATEFEQTIAAATIIPNWAADIEPITLDNTNQIAQLALFEGHTNYVHSVAFSPDRTILASASSDKTVRIWNLSTGEIQKVLNGHTSDVWSVAFSPNNMVLASGGDDAVRFWDPRTGNILGVAEIPARSIKFSPDGTILSAFSWNGLYLLDTTTYGVMHVLNGVSIPLSAFNMAFSPGGETLAIVEGDHIGLWNIQSGERETVLETNAPFELASVAFSPDGLFVASGGGYSDGTIRLWDLTTDTLKISLGGHKNDIYSVVFSPSAAILVSGGKDGAIKLWNVGTGEPLQRLANYSATLDVAFSSDGSILASGGSDGVVRLWGVAECRVIVGQGTVNIREGPGTDFEISHQLPLNQSFAVIGQAVGSDSFVWWKLWTQGWVRSDLINAGDNCANVPIIQP